MIIKRTNFFIKWFEKLTDNTQTYLKTYIYRLMEGNFSNCKSVGDGIHELKINYKSGYRVYFTNKNNIIIILLIGGDKSTQQKDIERAKKIKSILEV